MNLLMEKKRLMIIIGILLMISLCYIGAYYLYLNPMKTSLSLKESQLKTEQQLSLALETRAASVNESDFSSTAEMQKKLPVEPLVDQLVLDLEKAEVISDSFITSIEFNSDNQLVSAIESGAGQGSESSVQQTEQDGADAQQAVIQDESQESNNGKQEPEILLNMPEGLAKTTATVVVEADNYFSLEKFIQTLENLQRIVAIESISFSGPEEIFTLAEVDNLIQMTLTINAFYLPELKDLKDYIPKVQVPEPANKRDPFPSFGDVSEEEVEENPN